MNVANIIALHAVRVQWTSAGTSDNTVIGVTVFAHAKPNKGFTVDIIGLRPQDREAALETALGRMMDKLYPMQEPRKQIARPTRSGNGNIVNSGSNVVLKGAQGEPKVEINVRARKATPRKKKP